MGDVPRAGAPAEGTSRRPGLVPVEFPTTRQVGADPRQRAADLNAAFADPSIRAVLATIGGEDQIQVVPHLDADLVRADPKPFCGYSDNTNTSSWLWTHGVAGFYGGSTQVHLGPGPGVHLVGEDWADPAALTESGDREATEPWTWAGPPTTVTGRTWGGCTEVLQWILTAGRFPPQPAVLEGGVLLLGTSEELVPAREFGWILRSLGERGLLDAVDAVLVARPPASSFDLRPPAADRAAHRAAQRDTAIEVVEAYNPDAVVCIGVPFGHTRPQWVLPYGGEVTVDGNEHTIWADYR